MSETVRVYNLTDIETPELKRRGLVNQTIAVRSVLIRPGETKELAADAITMRDLKGYQDVGVVSVDVLPVEYATMKSRLASSKKPPAAAPKAVPAPEAPKGVEPVKVEKKG